MSHPNLYHWLPKGFAPVSYLSSILNLKFCKIFILVNLDTLLTAVLGHFKSTPTRLWLCPCGDHSIESLSLILRYTVAFIWYLIKTTTLLSHRNLGPNYWRKSRTTSNGFTRSALQFLE